MERLGMHSLFAMTGTGQATRFVCMLADAASMGFVFTITWGARPDGAS